MLDIDLQFTSFCGPVFVNTCLYERMEGLFAKETFVPLSLGSEPRKFGIITSQTTTVKVFQR